MSSCRWFVICALAFLVQLGPLRSDPLPRSVLVLEPSGRGGPYYPKIIGAFYSASASSDKPFSVFVESLDFNRFPDPAYSEALERYLLVKYGDKRTGVIVAISEGVLKFALRLRDKISPNIPIVFSMVDAAASQLLNSNNLTGTTITADLQSMVSTARAVVPTLRQIALVGADLASDTTYGYLRRQISTGGFDLKILDLTGLPMRQILHRVTALPDDAAIIYTSLYSDGEGHVFSPAHALTILAKKANRPIIVSADTFIGIGGTGGLVMHSSKIGEETTAIALRVLNGERAERIPVSKSSSLQNVFDWRELQRWQVKESSLPPGSKIEFRTSNPWKQYRWNIVAAAAAIFGLTMLAAQLMHEHQRRYVAERESQRRLSELAHVSRYAVAGEMSGAIAHELNQPLGAIESNTRAAVLVLQSRPPKIEELKEILADIRRDTTRASKIIVGLRELLTYKSTTQQEFDFNEAAREALSFADISATNSGIKLYINLMQEPALVTGDRIEMQQAVLNLAINSIEAINERPRAPRFIVCESALASENSVELSISDSGPGIPRETLEMIFEPFFTSKEHGMGMGLSLARSIVEAQGGRITAANGPTGGAVFRIRIPLAR
jgi:Signal transduction histidine kinase regulating C4-dicarboxylate transport system